jgi:hypothetical protein
MHAPESSDKDGWPEPADEPQRQRIDQQGIDGVQDEVRPVVSEGLLRLAEDGIIEEVRKGRQRTIEAGLAGGPPVRVLEDAPDVLGRRSPNPRVLENQKAVIPGEAGSKRIRKREQGKSAERDAGEQVAVGCQAMISFTTRPSTSVKRKSRPLYR